MSMMSIPFTRSLSQKLLKDSIRVDTVAPGPFKTPHGPATFDKEKVTEFGSDAPLGRVGQPDECGGCYELRGEPKTVRRVLSTLVVVIPYNHEGSNGAPISPARLREGRTR